VTHVRMWEARCVEGRTDEVVGWVQAFVVPAALEAGAHGAEVFRSQDRVVLLTRWPTLSGWEEPEADPSVVARAHAWSFESVVDQ
jgi:hypothetical protein